MFEVSKHCDICNGTGFVKVKVSWSPNPRDKVGFMPPIIHYKARACDCSREV